MLRPGRMVHTHMSQGVAADSSSQSVTLCEIVRWLRTVLVGVPAL